MKAFYRNALNNAKDSAQRFRVMLAAAQCRTLSDEDYYKVIL